MKDCNLVADLLIPLEWNWELRDRGFPRVWNSTWDCFVNLADDMLASYWSRVAITWTKLAKNRHQKDIKSGYANIKGVLGKIEPQGALGEGLWSKPLWSLKYFSSQTPKRGTNLPYCGYFGHKAQLSQRDQAWDALHQLKYFQQLLYSCVKCCDLLPKSATAHKKFLSFQWNFAWR